MDIDLLFASVDFDTVDDNIDIKNNAILKKCDSKIIRSLNGPRVTDKIMDHIPNR